MINNSAISGTGYINQDISQIGTNGPVIQVHGMSDGSTDYYRVLTLPLVYDYSDYTNFTSSTFDTYQFPVYQTDGFSSVNLSDIHVSTTTVSTDKGPLLLTIEASID